MQRNINKGLTMGDKTKVWVSFGAALLASTSLVTASLAAGAPPTAASDGRVLRAAAAPDAGAAVDRLQLAAGSAEEGGEGGEGGEAGDGAAESRLVESDSAYLTQLGLMRGHLTIGVELYRQGAAAAAATHMKHPEDELYKDLEEALEERGAPEFEAQLEALAARVETRAPIAEVEAAYDAVLAAIARAEDAVADPGAHEIGEVIHNLVHTAAEEYGDAVAGGKIVEGHEYQDALGFTRVAEDWLTKLAAAGANAAVVKAIGAQLAVIRPAWPSLVPPETAALDPSVIHGAAARIEIAVLHLKQ